MPQNEKETIFQFPLWDYSNDSTFDEAGTWYVKLYFQFPLWDYSNDSNLFFDI